MNRAATTLIELLLVLAILGVVFGLSAPVARKALDAIAVRAARETAFGVAMRARSAALARNGAAFVIDVPGRTAQAVDRQGVTVEQASLSSYRVDISADGSLTNQVVLQYDAHGIGRMASRTIRFRRGTSEAGLTFSSFGRVRRW